MMGRQFRHCGDGPAVAFDRHHPPGALGQQGAGQPARAWADLDDGYAGERAARASDPYRQIEVEKKILAQRFPC